MKTAFKKSFTRDLRNYSKDRTLLSRVEETILQVESSDRATDITNLKKLKAEGSYYRIRIGNYRLGLIIENETVTFVRLLHRKDIYRYFP
ncbi:MAG: type II toxin-antitoxin system RelE/ParE family toxin [Pseudomonadota bacterium]